MLTKAIRLSGLTAVLVLAIAGTASALALGSTAQPAGATAGACPMDGIVGQYINDPSTPYVVPAGGGMITQWQINTTGDAAGAPVTFVVLRPSHDGSGNLTVVGADPETLPNPLPSIASFSLSTPITVAAGDALGLYSNAAPTCYWGGGTTPPADAVFALLEPSPPAPGQTLQTAQTVNGGVAIDVAATLVTSQDVALRTSTAPAHPSAGSLALLSSSVTNSGPSSGPIAFTDTVPAGLTIDSASAGAGTCTVAGQLVTCSISGLTGGQSAPVNIVVTPTTAGTFTNTASATPTVEPDPNLANNVAAATLSVGSGPSQTQCLVPPLARVPLGLAKRILGLLNCSVGKVTHVHSRGVPKGDVIKTIPGPGRYPQGKTIGLQVSTGRAQKRHHGK